MLPQLHIFSARFHLFHVQSVSWNQSPVRMENHRILGSLGMEKTCKIKSSLWPSVPSPTKREGPRGSLWVPLDPFQLRRFHDDDDDDAVDALVLVSSKAIPGNPTAHEEIATLGARSAA